MRKRLLCCNPQRTAPKFEKFRRDWSEKNSMKRFLRKRLKLNTTLTTDRVNSASRFYGRSTGREPVHYEICELRRRPVESRCIEFIIRPIFLRRTHVILISFFSWKARLFGKAVSYLRFSFFLDFI
ncbi:hypothetical protein LEP1GSC170_2833 [Leptospira interrogans serovar Bataviae str. HAI135]|nr:hypothetical protein LEP1GSC170_2833 [Leptospira interrogans serovar Bataviae str. HAI135]